MTRIMYERRLADISTFYPAKFLIQVRGYTVDEDPMICLNIKIDFLSRIMKGFGF